MHDDCMCMRKKFEARGFWKSIYIVFGYRRSKSFQLKMNPTDYISSKQMMLILMVSLVGLSGIQVLGECSKQCESGASCVEIPSGEICLCLPGFTGEICEINIDECIGNPCVNGGSCLDLIDEFLCACPAGITDARCETDINECASQPCQFSGTCTDGMNSFTCECPGDQTGPLCQYDLTVCTIQCENGGACEDSPTGEICVCLPGYAGGRCQTSTNCSVREDYCLQGNMCSCYGQCTCVCDKKRRPRCRRS